MSTRDNNTADLLTAALDAAQLGWHVFPLRPGTKVPALHGLTDCDHTGLCGTGHLGWEQRATTDPERIRAAWTAGRFNIGLATGPAGLLVVDLDTAKPDDTPPAEWDLPGVRDGQDVLAVLADLHGQDVPLYTFTVATPSSGVHLYFLAPEVGEPLRNTQGKLGWKIDTRGHGGYVVAPGSRAGHGDYRVVVDLPPAPLPAWLGDLLRPAPLPAAPAQPVSVGRDRRGRYLQCAVRAEAAKVAHAGKGERNSTLYAAALALGQLVAGGELAAADVEATLLTAAGRHIAVGAYSERQARATIASGIARGANRPRQVAA
ncbi:bifunctional DNA primase/polymerase [Actinophytocola oryzae]|uniref:Bifunctional DNA primase/polymerase-like protein n=1 Tax=Actinophytocola oryzae TaxID=502181 RepID=A0A4V3FS01_9PSEU|nr:bifunctional DNA primase/polymerase [Actinophytocola oryzae]TDV45531.1 bifunctional DNA primase/polymerase-like protein [Actinophytocola oryzae]